ncbi:hypothetical protein [Paraflavitalea pollutisoli]|uniref:hypothetical protein n=1 Tax=Paraflavitalea pollutisoli TaxID=3034143 RepID=UPI0023EB13D8|nr:hypothetical protein [Paraflavitalea sp. H1-2-19X]
MAILIYGQRKAIIGLDDALVKCPVCEGDRSADVLMKSRYFHFYWIPLYQCTKKRILSAVIVA